MSQGYLPNTSLDAQDLAWRVADYRRVEKGTRTCHEWCEPVNFRVARRNHTVRRVSAEEDLVAGVATYRTCSSFRFEFNYFILLGSSTPWVRRTSLLADPSGCVINVLIRAVKTKIPVQIRPIATHTVTAWSIRSAMFMMFTMFMVVWWAFARLVLACMTRMCCGHVAVAISTERDQIFVCVVTQ